MHSAKFQISEKYCDRIKTDATIDQIGKVYNFYKRLLKKIL